MELPPHQSPSHHMHGLWLLGIYCSTPHGRCGAALHTRVVQQLENLSGKLATSFALRGVRLHPPSSPNVLG